MCSTVGAGGATASCATGGTGEGAAFCAVVAGAGTWATGGGGTRVGPGETGGVTFVWLLTAQKTAAIATSTTPASKAHNQRDITFPRVARNCPRLG